jgi:hypothetical protein
MIEITIESTDLETRNKKTGGSYTVQTAYAHTFDRTGPKRYPEEIRIFPPKGPDGKPIPYPMGDYYLSPHCIRVDNGYLSLGFVELQPIKKQK